MEAVRCIIHLVFTSNAVLDTLAEAMQVIFSKHVVRGILLDSTSIIGVWVRVIKHNHSVVLLYNYLRILVYLLIQPSSSLPQ